MTIDEERLKAISATREYLEEKINGRTKLRNRKERVRVFALLRHYPEKHWVDDVKSILLGSEAVATECIHGESLQGLCNACADKYGDNYRLKLMPTKSRKEEEQQCG